MSPERALPSERRATGRRYAPGLPALFPVRLSADAIEVDFTVDAGPAGGRPLDHRVSPRQVLAWLRSMPAYRAGVPVRLGAATDPALAFEKFAALTDLLDPARPATWTLASPLDARSRAFLARPRHGLLVEARVAPSAGLDGALALARSAAPLDPHRLHWRLGPLGPGAEGLAAAVLEALPRGSRIDLAPARRPLAAAALADLEARARALGHRLSAFACHAALAPCGRGFPGVDAITAQADLGRRALDLLTCAGCPSRTLCHGPLDEAALRCRLTEELAVLGLEATGPARRTGPRALEVAVDQPAAAGDEAYLSHALGLPVAVALVPPGGGRAAGATPAVLRRWWSAGFLPVTELNAAAEHALDDLARRTGLAATPATA